MGRLRRSLRGFLAPMACLLCIGLLLSEVTESRETKAAAPPPLVAAEMGRFRDLQGPSRTMDPLFASKRRVPNGPDPIHNRGAGKSGRPPGKA